MKSKKPCGKLSCGPCGICNIQKFKYTHLCSIDSVDLISCIKSLCSEITDTTCICNGCRQKYYKKLKDPLYTPEKSRKKQNSTPCFLSIYLQCTSLAEVETQCSIEDFNEIFSLEAEAIPESIFICKSHRSTISNFHINKSIIYCAVCDCALKGKKYSSTNLADESFQKLSEINKTFQAGSENYLCPSCYRYALRIDKTAHSLEEIEDRLRSETFVVEDKAANIEGNIMQGLKETLLHLCEILKHKHSFLLSYAYDYYVNVMESICQSELECQRCVKTKTWLHSKISEIFNDVLCMHTSASRMGCFFYMKNLTFNHMLEQWHNSSSKVRALQKKLEEYSESKEKQSIPHVSDLSLQSQLCNVASTFNTRLHAQAKDITSHFVDNPTQLNEFQFESVKKLIDPFVWNSVVLLTASKDESRYFKNSTDLLTEEQVIYASDSTPAGMKKKHRRIVIVFLLQFILNEEYNYPLHVAIANIIKRLSHSSKLIHMMNRFGFSSSEDTLARFLQKIQDLRVQSGLLSCIDKSKMLCVSIDNIDVLSPFAAVTADKSRSWHGTSIMAQQPKPESEALCSYEYFDDNVKTHTSDVVQSHDDEGNTSQSTGKKPSVRRKLPLMKDLNIPSKRDFEPPVFKTYMRDRLSENIFCLSDDERQTAYNLLIEIVVYISQRYFILKESDTCVLPSFKLKLALKNEPNIEKSQFAYLYVLDEKADSPVTMKKALGVLYDTFQINKCTNHLVIAGDGATIKLLYDIKSEYGKALDWVIPFLGDWHVLKNFQEVLFKIFWDAGLKDVAKMSHKSSTLQSLASCSNFKRNHRFLIQVHEAVYMCQWQSFLEYRSGQEECVSNDEFKNSVSNVVSKLIHKHGKYHGIEEFKDAEMNFKEQMMPFMDQFIKYCNDMSEKYETFRFWNRFLNEDVLCYINLWIAIRQGNWNLRMAALKQMAALFHAFDRHNYSKLIPLHISSMHALPPHVFEHFKRGCFVSSIKGTNFASVAFDEGHEMLINKDVKTAFTHSLPKHMEQLVGTMEYQAQLVCQFEEQLGLNMYDNIHRDLQWSVTQSEFKNVTIYFDKFSNTKVFNLQQESSLFHAFSNAIATAVQQKSLLSYRKLGSESYESYYSVHILKQTSVQKPVQKKFRLKTFSKEKLRKKKVTDLEKENKLITQCYKRALAFSKETKTPVSDLCQYVEYPRAICTQDGLPHKGAKSVVYDFFQKRYTSNYQITTTSYNFVPNTCVIIEGMNIIYSSPLHNLRTFSDYAKFIVGRWIISFFKKGVCDVRILFDQVGTQGISPKDVERSRRDVRNGDDEMPVFVSLDDDVLLPKPWSSFLKIRENKHSLCRYLSNKFIELVQNEGLQRDQLFVTSGGFHVGVPTTSTWSGKSVNEHGIAPHNLIHNHEESDTQIWLHVFNTQCANVLVYSIDRDIGIISLPLDFGAKKVTVQYRAKIGDEKFLNINTLQSAIDNDSDLACLRDKGVNAKKCLQVLYISSGCDFVSFFAHIGKNTFFKVFFNNVRFITGGFTDTDGNLTQTNINVDSESGMLSFYRLILCTYFHANRACLHKYNSVIDLYNSIDLQNAVEHHHTALDIVRTASWKGTYEDELLPSNSSLSLHWLRSCWVSTVWGNACSPRFDYPNITMYGYNVSNENGSSKVSIVWDTDENISRIRKNVLYLTRGCGCKKSKCKKKICKCFKAGKKCGPGCQCKDCENVICADSSSNVAIIEDVDSQSSDDSDIEDDNDENQAQSGETEFVSSAQDILSLPDDISLNEYLSDSEHRFEMHDGSMSEYETEMDETTDIDEMFL